MHIVDYFVIAGYFALVMYLGYYSMKKIGSGILRPATA